jgi:GT2 family glycosyltransferase
MTGKNSLAKAASVFLGVLPQKFGPDFLASTRSIAFKKAAWEKVGGFPENLPDTAEDTVFNYKILKKGLRISRVKEAVVEWGMPENLLEFFKKVYQYAKGDAKTKIFNYSSQGLASHNIKAVFVIVRYCLGLSLLILSTRVPVILLLLLLLVILYLIRAYQKTGLWGIVLQIVSDFAVMSGFVSGLI